ncbi:SWIM zinc finger family protein [Lyngbya confervoides]|uniref:Metal-binding protein n=1 Tax=Lyngbya confervoides BDU141951 TaxID=1574623 RepID=A0ABD4T0R0_9CYAN|nr:metal-binding protein [Lyngbya confervoides]MCM1982356.1 metal-binding protein [Lyngbya confervoides BDU141951]
MPSSHSGSSAHPRSPLISVQKGGTKASGSQSLAEGPPSPREWWAQRWVDVLESFGWRRRLERARNYVREGRVLDLEFKGEKVLAQVQGTAPDPYSVSLSLDRFDEEQWGYVIEELSGRAIFAAKLLAGEMPQNIEEAFTASGLSLFPFSKFDIHSRCSCPDPVNPCKHIGAVYYLLGDYFSQDPFILFQLRGRSKASILEDLRQHRSDAHAPGPGEERPDSPTESFDITAEFWRYDQELDPTLVVITPPASQETILDVLGPLPIDQLEASKASASPSLNSAFMECLKGVYQRASQQAMLTAMRNA